MSRAFTDWMAVLERVEQSDPGALAELSQLVAGWLRRYRAQESLDRTEDLFQNVMIVVLDHYRRDRLQAPEAFVNFVGGVVRNCLRAALRQRAKDARHESVSDAALEERLGADERRDGDPVVLTDLGQALDRLSDRHRAVVEALYVRGETYSEAADSLSLTLGTLKRLQKQGLRSLREAMGLVPAKEPDA
jgi:RNA polymerase sigma-70 factor, ECF subfamily